MTSANNSNMNSDNNTTENSIKDKKSVALKYNKNKDSAPKVIASGKGSIAEKILKKAREENIPIKNDSDIVEVLAKLDIGEEIPEDLYRVIAEILSFVYSLDKKNRQF